MTRGVILPLLLTVSALFLASAPAAAQSTIAKFTLDRFYNPGFANGGTWRVVGLTESVGFAKVDLSLLNTATATIVAPPELEVRNVFDFGGGHNVTIEDNYEAPLPYGIGVIGGPFPSSYVDPPNLQVHPAWSNVGSFTGGVVLAEGTFAPGQNPTWPGFANGGFALMFINTTSADRLPDQGILQIRSTEIPEPAAASLAGLAVVGMFAARRSSLGRLRG